MMHNCLDHHSVRRSLVTMASWVEEDKRRMLHAVYRVGDMDKTIQWYKVRYYVGALLIHPAMCVFVCVTRA